MIVQRIIPHLLVKFVSVHFLIEQRKRRIEQDNTVVVKREDFIWVGTDMHLCAERQCIFRFLTQFGCLAKEWGPLGKFCFVVRKVLFFFPGQVTIQSYQLANAFGCLCPG
ncbi:hypothetical protein SDC9_151707 [bioreactor metagenome]|uniref:Uncharacterized protein n=1 Tax=bioreactor metagenome TaxID=1076179 RepID=A0A645ETD9_9ZZZZ